MFNLTQLVARRSEILEKIKMIKNMRKGVLNAKYYNLKHKDGEVVEKGPYYVLTKKGSGNKTVSQAVTASDAPRVQEQVDNYKKFRQLSDEYVDVCEKITLFCEHDDDDEAKKN